MVSVLKSTGGNVPELAERFAKLAPVQKRRGRKGRTPFEASLSDGNRSKREPRGEARWRSRPCEPHREQPLRRPRMDARAANEAVRIQLRPFSHTGDSQERLRRVLEDPPGRLAPRSISVHGGAAPDPQRERDFPHL